MAVEDTDKINAQVEPVKIQVQYAQKKGKADAVVSSPATSVEHRVTEKKNPMSQTDEAGASSDLLNAEKLTKEKSVLSRSQLEELTDGINKELSFFTSSVQFKIEEVEESEIPGLKGQGDSDPSIGIKKKEIVVSVVDKRTGEVVRKIPPEDLLQSLNNASMFLGLLVDQIV